MGHMSCSLNFNFSLPILKSSDSLTMEKFHPMVIWNFLFKLIMKILANLLALIAACIVSPFQFGFIKGHNISDCIVAASKSLEYILSIIT